LDLVRGRISKSDIQSLAITIDAAIHHYDKLSGIQEDDFAFLRDLLRFLKEFGLIEERIFDPVAEELRARIHIKTGTFDHYLFEWDRGTQQKAFEREAVKQAEIAERMHANKKQALARQAQRRQEQQQRQEEVSGPPLGEELQSREPVPEDLRRLCPEERSLVHSLRTAGREPINWIALRGEVFRNRLSRRDYEQLATLEEPEREESYLTPPESPMH
jgi:hypothetical protein